MCFFETAQMHHVDQTHSRAALELAQSAEKALQAVLQQMSAASLVADADAVRIPGRAFLSEDKDYRPLRFSATLPSGEALPQWLRIEPDDGRLVTTRMPNTTEVPLKVKVELMHAEGAITSGVCTIVGDRYTPTSAPWFTATGPIAQRYADSNTCALESGVRKALLEHFSEVYDFHRKSPRERSLGAWLDAMARILGLLRAAAGINMALAPVGLRTAK